LAQSDRRHARGGSDDCLFRSVDGRPFRTPLWARILLGIVFIVAGAFVLGDLALATLISTIFIGAMAIAAGAFEIVHSFWTKGWGGFLWQIFLGLAYIVIGFILLTQPVGAP
jgi:uncharacterized membrane protein HdeD (DUF308 family)